jgi:glycosyltransferase involved in cell wall biosynthesis
MSKRRLLIIIPAFNEDRTLFNLIRRAKEYGDVVVLDDASTDDTKIIALKAGAKVLSNNINLGYEKTLSIGIKAAIDNIKYSYLVTIDADGEHRPDDIAKYANRLNAGIDLVCGNRSYKNRFSEEIWGKFSSRLYGVNDPLCGFKGYSLEFIRKSDFSNDFSSLGELIGTRLLKKMLHSKARHENINIRVLKRSGVSKFGVGIRVNFMILLTLMQFLRA